MIDQAEVATFIGGSQLEPLVAARAMSDCSLNRRLQHTVTGTHNIMPSIDDWFILRLEHVFHKFECAAVWKLVVVVKRYDVIRSQKLHYRSRMMRKCMEIGGRKKFVELEYYPSLPLVSRPFALGLSP